MTAIAWAPHDLGTSRLLLLPYWYWTEEDPRWSYLASPSRGGVLLPVRHYAKVVAKFGLMFRDNNGADFAKNREHPGAQELSWGLGDYPVTPEAHMRNIRRLGQECRREAEAALKTVKANATDAQRIANYMKAYQLLADYYEQKVLAAVAALIYGFGGDKSLRAEAERHADEVVKRCEIAAHFLEDHIDKKIKARWGGKELTAAEMIEHEKKERAELGKLFGWRERQ